MSTPTLFEAAYEDRKRPMLERLLGELRPLYAAEELDVLRIDPISRGVLSQPSGRGFVNRDILETLLGNLLECAAPGSHNAVEAGRPEISTRSKRITVSWPGTCIAKCRPTLA